MVFAMISTVISGTPRTNSMKITEASRTIGSFERRPSARRTPNGSENTMPTVATRSVTRMPPHSAVGTSLEAEPGRSPSRRMKETDREDDEEVDRAEVAPGRPRATGARRRRPRAATKKTSTRQRSATG